MTFLQIYNILAVVIVIDLMAHMSKYIAENVPPIPDNVNKVANQPQILFSSLFAVEIISPCTSNLVTLTLSVYYNCDQLAGFNRCA